MQSISGTKKGNRTTVTKMTNEAFINHVIVPEQDKNPVKMWYCGKDGTSIYNYRIISAPNIILVYGDVGNYMVRANNCDLVPWLQEAIKSEDYMISKIVNKGEVFFPDEANALLNRLSKQYTEEKNDNGLAGISRVRDKWDEDYNNADKFAEMFVSAGEPLSLLDCVTDYEWDVYWTIECLSKFIELLDNISDRERK